MNTQGAKPVLVRDIMVTDVVTVHPETSLIEAAQFLTERNLDGLPVVAKDNTLIGIVTDRDLIEKGTAIHLPTLAKFLSDVSFYKSDKKLLPEVKKMLSLRVKDVMNSDPLVLPDTSLVEEAVEIFAHHHAVNPVPVVDVNKKLVGVIARFDIVKLFHSIPHLSNLEADHNQKPEIPQGSRILRGLEKQFVLISKPRTRWWLLASISFAVVGFIIAFALILRIGPS